METKFNFKSAICTSREQSEVLLKLGLKKETADMCWTKMAAIRGTFYVPELAPIKMVSWRHTPAWSLHRLIELIWEDGEHDMSLETHRPFEDCIERIEYMINQSHCFNKEYLV